MLPPRDHRPLVAWTLWSDGVFELALGVLLASAPLTGLLDAFGLPAPAWPPVVVGFGLVLLPVGAGLVALSGRWTEDLVRTLGLVNGAGALLFAIWLVWAWAGFAPPGRLLTGVVAVALAVLAVVELAAVRRREPVPSGGGPPRPWFLVGEDPPSPRGSSDDRGRDGLQAQCGHQVDHVREATDVPPGQTLDAAQAVVHGVRVQVQAPCRRADVEVVGGVGQHRLAQGRVEPVDP